MKKSIHYPLVLLVITALCVAGIDLVYSSVVDKIKMADEKKARSAVCCIFKDTPEGDIGKKQESLYKDDTVKWFKCSAGYAVISSAQGFDGAVTVMAGWDKTLAKVIGIYVLSHTETPGLGTRIAEPPFTNQFIGINIDDVALNRDGGQIDAITSSTISSSAVVDAVRNTALEKVKLLKDSE